MRACRSATTWADRDDDSLVACLDRPKSRRSAEWADTEVLHDKTDRNNANLVDCVQIEVARPGLDLHRRATLGVHHRLVEEPWRQAVDDLVSRLDQCIDGYRKRAKATDGELDVLRLEVEVPPLAQRGRDDLARGRLTMLVGKPVLVLRHGSALQGVDQARLWHVVRIAESEVANVRLPRLAA